MMLLILELPPVIAVAVLLGLWAGDVLRMLKR